MVKPPSDGEKWVRGRGCNMIKSLNIPRTDAIVFNTIIKTLTDTSELHKHLADKLGVDQGYRQRRADIRKNIKDLEVQLDTVETSLADLETDVRTHKIDGAIYERVKTNLTCQREDLLEKIEQASIRYERLDHDVQWLSALSNLTLDTARFEKNFSDRKKKDWLSRIIERIDVTYLHDTQEHEVNLRLKIPLFSDASDRTLTVAFTKVFVQFSPETTPKDGNPTTVE